MEYKISDSGTRLKNSKTIGTSLRVDEGESRETKEIGAGVALNILWDLLCLLAYTVYVYCSFPIKYYLSLKNLKSLENKIILVTGAASGIGREICLQLADLDKSITLICWDVSEKHNKDLVQELKRGGLKKAHAFTVDVSDREQVNSTAETIKSEIGDVQILFNNAGISGDGLPLWEQNPKTIERVVQVNLLSSFWTLQAFLPAMIEQGEGHIVTTSSILGLTQIKHLSPYIASKFGVMSTIEALKLDLACDPRKPNIQFTTVYPNLTMTPMVTNFNKKAKYDFLIKGVGPAAVAEKIITGMRQNREHVYPLGLNRLFPLFTALTPSAVFRKLHEIFTYDAKKVD